MLRPHPERVSPVKLLLFDHFVLFLDKLVKIFNGLAAAIEVFQIDALKDRPLAAADAVAVFVILRNFDEERSQ